MKSIVIISCFIFPINAFSSIDLSVDGIIERVEAEQKKIKNFQCTVEYDDYKNVQAIDRMSNMHRRGEAGALVQKFVESKTRAIDGYVHNYQIQQIAYDSKGRIKTYHQLGHYEASGKLELESKKKYALWKDNEGIVFTDCDAPAAIISQEKPINITRLRRPTYSFGGRFIEDLKQAINDGNPVIVQEDEEQRITLKFNLNSEDQVGIIDPQKGYSVVQSEKYRNGDLVVRFKTEPQEVQEGIWFPTGGTIEDYFSDGMLITSTTMKVKSIEVNDISLNEAEVFCIKFPEGTLVEDLIANCIYTVGDPTSFTPRGSSIGNGSE